MAAEPAAADVGGSAADLHEVRLPRDGRRPVAVGLDVGHVADVAVGARGRAVGLARGIEVRARAHAVARAAIALLVDVDRVLAVGPQALDGSGDRDLVALLHEGDGSLDRIALRRLERGDSRRAAADPHLCTAGNECSGNEQRDSGHGASSKKEKGGTSPPSYDLPLVVSSYFLGGALSDAFSGALAAAAGAGAAGAAATIGVGFGMGLPAFFMLP